MCALFRTCELASCLARPVPKLLISSSFQSWDSSFLLSAPALCFYVSPSAYQFLFYLDSISFCFISISLCLCSLPFIMLPYLTMSSDTSPLFSASVCFHPCSLSTSLVFPLSIPLSWSVSLPPSSLSLSVLISVLSNLLLYAL